jgi:hypothetical protein
MKRTCAWRRTNMQRNGKLFLLVCLSVTSGCLKRELPEYEQVGSNYKFKLRGEIVFDKDTDNGSVVYGYLYKQYCRSIDWMDSMPLDSKKRIFLSYGMTVPENNIGKYKLVALSGAERSLDDDLPGFEKWTREENYPHDTREDVYFFSEKPIAPGGGYYYLNCTITAGSTMEQTACRVYYNVLPDVRLQYWIRGNLFPQFSAYDKCIQDFVTSVARPISEN